MPNTFSLPKPEEIPQVVPEQARELYSSFFDTTQPYVDKFNEAKEQADTINSYYQTFQGVTKNIKPNLMAGIRPNATGTILNALNNPITASINELPTDAKIYAELVKISSEVNKKGIDSAVKRARQNVPEYTIDTELSTTEYIVAEKNGKLTVAFRGTDPGKSIAVGQEKIKFNDAVSVIKSGKNASQELISKGVKTGKLSNIPEPIMWYDVMYTGKEGQRWEQHNLEKIIELTQRKYGKGAIEHVTGYSMGGAKAHRFAEMIGVESTTFNPLMGKNMMSSNHSNNIHRVFRTTTDIATLQAIQQGAELPSNIVVESIDPLEKVEILENRNLTLSERMGVVESHNLEHFTTEGDRSNRIREAQERMDERARNLERQKPFLNEENYNNLFDEMVMGNADDMRIISNDYKQIIEPQVKVMKATTAVGRGLAGFGRGFVMSAGIGAGLSSLADLADLHIDPMAQETVIGAVSGGAGVYTSDKIAQKFLGSGAVTPSSIRRGILVGAGSTASQVAVANSFREYLINNGVDADTAEFYAQTTGGGVAGGVGYVEEQALIHGSRLIGQSAIYQQLMGLPRTFIQSMMTGGVEALGVEAGLAESLLAGEVAVGATEAVAETGAIAGAEALLGAEVAGAEVALATEATAIGLTNIWNPVGWFALSVALGAGISLGLTALSHQNTDQQHFVLGSGRNEAYDYMISSDPAIRRVIDEFEARKDYSPEKIAETEAMIDALISDLPHVPENYGYSARLFSVPEGYREQNAGLLLGGYMLERDYSQIPAEIQNLSKEDFDQVLGASLLIHTNQALLALTPEERNQMIEGIYTRAPGLRNDPQLDDVDNDILLLGMLIDMTQNDTDVNEYVTNLADAKERSLAQQEERLQNLTEQFNQQQEELAEAQQREEQLAIREQMLSDQSTQRRRTIYNNFVDSTINTNHKLYSHLLQQPEIRDVIQRGAKIEDFNDAVRDYFANNEEIATHFNVIKDGELFIPQLDTQSGQPNVMSRPVQEIQPEQTAVEAESSPETQTKQ